MTKANKLRVCDWSLLPVTILILASSIQLEATGSRSSAWVWAHVAVGLVFFAGVIWHLYLHFGWRGWMRRLRTQKSSVTRWLALFGFLTALTAVAALIHWMIFYVHSPLGAIHGKLGFVFIALAIGHTLKRIRFFSAKRRK